MNKLLFLSFLTIISVQVMASESDFWVWFTNNQKTIESYEYGDEKLLDDILLELHKYNENLYFEFSTHDEINEFIVSAAGDNELFDSVFKLVASAPSLDNWEFIALKPAMGFEFVTTYEGVDYDPETIWFLPLVSNSNPKKLGLRVGIAGYNSEIHKNSENAIWILLDAGLGELKTAQEIHHVETVELPDNHEEKGYIEMKEIDAYLNWRNKNT